MKKTIGSECKEKKMVRLRRGNSFDYFGYVIENVNSTKFLQIFDIEASQLFELRTNFGLHHVIQPLVIDIIEAPYRLQSRGVRWKNKNIIYAFELHRYK